MASLLILKSGLLTTIQDLGRSGLGRFGVPVSGAMDPLALRIANRLVENPDNLPALEITAVGPAIEFHQETRFSLAGANLTPQLSGRPVEVWQAHLANAGEVIEFGARRQGARCYLAVHGGVRAQTVMGSAATDLDSGMGGLDGRPLAAGTTLQISEQKPGVRRRLLPEMFRVYSDPFQIRFLPNSDPDFGPALARFKASSFRVSRQSSRMGFRLAGAKVELPVSDDIISEPIPAGSIQVPPGGDPIMLMADRQSVGGYPRIGYVITADIPKAAQLWIGHPIRFMEVTLEEACSLLREQERMLQGAIV